MAVLSNSAFEAFFTCPTFYQNRYELGLTLEREPGYLQFGTRMHALLRCHYLGGLDNCPPPSDLDPLLELEAQAMLAGYQANYPVEDFEVIDTEKEFTLGIPRDNPTHTLRGRIDMVVRRKADSKLCLFESKTESRGSKRNLPQVWLAKHQVSLYTWAASQLYGEEVDSAILNVLTRGSVGKQLGPIFHRDTLHRTPTQVSQALQDFTWVASRIDDLGQGPYPRNTSACVSEKGYACTYFSLCHLEDKTGLVTVEPYGYLQSL